MLPFVSLTIILSSLIIVSMFPTFAFFCLSDKTSDKRLMASASPWLITTEPTLAHSWCQRREPCWRSTLSPKNGTSPTRTKQRRGGRPLGFLQVINPLNIWYHEERNLKTIIQVIVSILTAALTALGTTSCMGHGPIAIWKYRTVQTNLQSP